MCSRFLKMLLEAGTLQIPKAFLLRSGKFIVTSHKSMLTDNFGSQFPLGFCFFSYSHILIQPQDVFWSVSIFCIQNPAMVLHIPACSKDDQYQLLLPHATTPQRVISNTSTLSQKSLCLSCRMCHHFHIRK